MPEQLVVIVHIGVSVLLLALSIPLAYGKVPPNHWYGFRTPRTLSSAETWYRSNRLGGQYLSVAALVQLALLAVLVPLWPKLAESLMQWGILMLAPILVAIILWLLRIRKW